MLIEALCDYYDVLSQNGDVPREGYQNINISFGVAISPEGKLDDIIDMRRETIIKSKSGKEKKKQLAVEELFPDDQTISGVRAIVLDYRPEYIFGLALNHTKDGFELAVSKKGESKHDSYIEKNLSFIEGLDGPLINAFRNFLKEWDPQKETTNIKLIQIIKEFSSSKMEIFLTGHPSDPLQNNEHIQRKWDTEYSASSAGSDEKVIAKTHDKIKGMGGAMGAPLVSANKQSMESYGNLQGANSGISVKEMKKYTSTLNYLKKSTTHHQKIIDTDVFYWAMNNSDREVDFFNALCMGRNDAKMNADQVDLAIDGMISDAKSGDLICRRIENMNMFDPNVTFFIVGMNASKGKISIEWFVKDKFAEIVKNVAEFQNDLKLTHEERPVSICKLLSSMGSTKSRETHVSSPMAAKTYAAIFKKSMLPRSMLDTAVRRCKTDIGRGSDNTDNTKKIIGITETRMRLIKAFILGEDRRRNKEEEFGMALDVSNTNPYYVCGRLFAVMEKVQLDGAPALNRTIKDAYFSVAASTPATIMPKLITLNGHHMKKLKGEMQTYYAKLIQSIIGNLDDHFPKTASIEDQGRFMIGYFQQRKDLYTSHKDESL